ncbi:MAG: Gfo/Idh/MocA family oxidoreductase [Clostridia bacterium]|nr:Gfo/Idh/MocA family oxidoreductase [Clostridia bacterium]
MEKIRIGVFGVGRGMDIAKNFMLLGCDIVAVCDNHAERLQQVAATLDCSVAVYDDFDKFIEHDMDAVIVANFFHEHAPYTIRLFEKGIHVFCECISNGTMAEGVQLVKAFEKHKSKAVYMLAENYPHMKFNREMKRICDGGSLGKLLYAEGEYNHPVNAADCAFTKRYIYSENHWRNYLPRTYYITHSLSPIMWATGATPKKVTAFSVFAPIRGDVSNGCYAGDSASIITTQNDDGSVFHFTGSAKFGAHNVTYRICGANGSVENMRGMENQIMLRYNEWSKPTKDTRATLRYEPQWNDPDEELIKHSGHGGGDFLVARMFLNCIREKRQPEFPFDLYSSVNMSSVAILAQRSVLNGGMPYDIPDFRCEEDCKKYENDYESPFYCSDGRVPTIPCCTDPSYKPTEKQLELFREVIK